jgi:hypothetical protein
MTDTQQNVINNLQERRHKLLLRVFELGAIASTSRWNF